MTIYALLKYILNVNFKRRSYMGWGYQRQLQTDEVQLSLYQELLDIQKGKNLEDNEKKLRNIINDEEMVNQVDFKRNGIIEKFKVLFKKQEIFDI